MALTGHKFPRDAMPTDEARFHTFITESLITASGDLARDYREALAAPLEITDENAHSMNDLFKRYDESL